MREPGEGAGDDVPEGERDEELERDEEPERDGEPESDERAISPPPPATERAAEDEEATVETMVENPAQPGGDAPSG